MKFRLPRKIKKWLKSTSWVDRDTGKTVYPWNSQLDYKKYKSGEIIPISMYIDISI